MAHAPGPGPLIRRAAAASVVAAGTLLLAGCSGGGGGDFTSAAANNQPGPAITDPTTAAPVQPAEPVAPPPPVVNNPVDPGGSGQLPPPVSPAQPARPAQPRQTQPRITSPGAASGSRAGTAHGSAHVVRVVTSGLDVPWGMAELPDGTVLVTTRDDFHVYRLAPYSGKRTDLGRIPGVSTNVSEGGEGGLLGIAVSPQYTSNHRLYLYWSTSHDNRIGWVTYHPSSRSLGRPHVIVSGIPHGVHHNGGRLAFGPDGMLYASTGESGVPSLSQDKHSLGGKILRMTPNGHPAPGNPFGNLVWTYGHRNVQGLAFDSAGRLFASEFGDHDYDELNWIRPGHDYGWPESQGFTSIPGLTGPITEFGTESDSPSGIAIANGSVWMAALQGERLYRIPLDGHHLVAHPTSFLDGRWGRLRSVLALNQHTLLVSTSNRDGRTSPRAGDDKILMVRVS